MPEIAFASMFQSLRKLEMLFSTWWCKSDAKKNKSSIEKTTTLLGKTCATPLFCLVIVFSK